QPASLPTEPRPAHIEVVPFDTGDDITDALLRAALVHLGESGYEGAVLADLVRTAGYSEGAVFARYPSKEALFLDAISRDQDIALPSQREYLQRLEATYGVGIAEAVAIRDTMRPLERRICIVDMEHARMAWHNPALIAVEEQRLQALTEQVLAQDPNHPDFSDPANLHVARAMGLGISFLPLLADNAWDLPFDVVTVPLAEQTQVQDSRRHS
ncbi:MAG: TetR/AcrR family transcriptional regulator, partial [Actinomycetales bacterium]